MTGQIWMRVIYGQISPKKPHYNTIMILQRMLFIYFFFWIYHFNWIFLLFRDNSDELNNKYKLRKLLLLRQFCQKNGVQLVLWEFNFENKHKEIFHEDDILNLFPIVKHVPPKVRTQTQKKS